MKGGPRTMNVASILADVLRRRHAMDEAREEQCLYRLKEPDNTDGRLERRIVELADGRSAAEILRTLTEGVDQAWADWYSRHVPEVMHRLEQRGFIRVEKRKGSRTSVLDANSGADVCR